MGLYDVATAPIHSNCVESFVSGISSKVSGQIH